MELRYLKISRNWFNEDEISEFPRILFSLCFSGVACTTNLHLCVCVCVCVEIGDILFVSVYYLLKLFNLYRCSLNTPTSESLFCKTSNWKETFHKTAQRF